jgi:hypothetical protein
MLVINATLNKILPEAEDVPEIAAILLLANSLLGFRERSKYIFRCPSAGKSTMESRIKTRYRSLLIQD